MQTTPRQTLLNGQRVELAVDIEVGSQYLRAGLEGTVLGFATPQIQQNQVWPDESYWVRLDCDTEDSLGRVLNREQLRRSDDLILRDV